MKQIAIITVKHIMRKGKTERDHKSGAWLRCIKNKQERAEWQKSTDRNKSFKDIAHTCNGKKNRYLFTSTI